MKPAKELLKPTGKGTGTDLLARRLHMRGWV
jgi:hypothetical protein